MYGICETVFITLHTECICWLLEERSLPHAFHATCICMLAPIPGHMQLIQALFCICNRMSLFHFFDMHPNHSRTFTFCSSVNIIRIYLQHSSRCRSDTIASDLRNLPAASSTPLWLRQKVMSVPCLTTTFQFIFPKLQRNQQRMRQCGIWLKQQRLRQWGRWQKQQRCLWQVSRFSTMALSVIEFRIIHLALDSFLKTNVQRKIDPDVIF